MENKIHHLSGFVIDSKFDITSPEEVVANKRHVYEEGYGWKEKAQAAKRVIDRTA